MNAKQLFHQDGKTAGVWYCGQCRHVAKTQGEADACCAPRRCDCGTEVARGWAICERCRDAKDAAKEAERFAAAAKLTEWDGPVMHGDDYFACIEDLMGHHLWNSGEQDRPAYVWACREVPVCVLDYDKIVSNATQHAYDGFEVGMLAECGLREKLAEFNLANAGIVNWEPDYTRAVLLGLPEAAAESEGPG